LESERKIKVNYLFFSLFFLFLFISSIINILLVDPPLYALKAFFYIDAFNQSLIETSLLVVLAHFCERHCSKKIYLCFLGALFFFFLFQIIDFILIRMFHFSFLEALNFVLDETLCSFIELLKASNISLMIWLGIGVAMFFLPVLGILLFKGMEWLIKKKPLFIPYNFFFLIIFLLPFSLFFWNFSQYWMIHPDLYHAMLKTLPWKTTLFHPSSMKLAFKGNLKNCFQQKLSLSHLELPNIEEKANIYLFIIESLREDFITEKNTPNLFDFKRKELFFDLALSSANATQYCWFSILHGKFPFFWAECKKKSSTLGSPFLGILKQFGYTTHLYSAAELDYNGMRELLFGKKNHLLHHSHFFPHLTSICECDGKAIETLCRDVEREEMREKRCFITFLDSTHFPYSWPKEKTSFFPIVGESCWLSPCPSLARLETIKNRYRNSLHWIDELFGRFIKTLKEKNLYDNSIIVVSADHGEEFLEHGHLFHGSLLSKEQTHIPLYLKLGKVKKEQIPIANQKLISQIDILPTLHHYLFQSLPPKNLYDGGSIFDPSKPHFALSARFNASRAPFEFFLHDGEKKLLVRFKNHKAIFETPELEFVLLKDQNDCIELFSPQETKKEVEKRFHVAFQQLFLPKPSD
jgi:glucan phosphoethanolaminetransferase (alkaline phosphatase superfamily)